MGPGPPRPLLGRARGAHQRSCGESGDRPPGGTFGLIALFLLFGIFRFLQIVTVEAGGDSPTDMVVGDGPLRTAIAMWLLTFFVIIYVTP